MEINSMSRSLRILGAVALMALAACTRIETGEIGLRVDAAKQVQGTELQPGSFNQVIIGDVLTFPVRDIAIALENKQPLTKDNSALGDLDLTAIYAINPAGVSDLWTTKSRSFHSGSKDGDILLMYNYMATLVNNAVYKAVREYEALTVNDKRAEIEEKVKLYVAETLRAEKLDNILNLNTVQVRAISPAQSIIDSANAVVRSQNELRVKQTEVEIAKKESERMAALANNSTQSIAYMQAQSQLMIAEGIKNGKVHTIVVPADFKGMVNVGK
jgi:regulator of protease activity HflC (stomatin/prohibitin superfamily)